MTVGLLSELRRGVLARSEIFVKDRQRNVQRGREIDEYNTDYVVLATGAKRDLAEDLGCALIDEGIVDVDVTMETSVADAYATGAMVRAEEWEAVISAGDGAAAALNILTKEKGEHFHDFDVPEADQ